MTTPDITVNLRHYSLNRVVASDKSLWKRPRKWTSAHLSALGIRPRRRLCRDIHPTTISGGPINGEDEDEDSSDTDNEGNHEAGGEQGDQGEPGDEHYAALIPDLTPARLRQFMASFPGGSHYETRASHLIRLLRRILPSPAPAAAGRRDMKTDRKRRDDDVLGRRFSFRWMTPQLALGPRTYKLHFLFHLFLNDALVLPYVDSSCVLRPRFRVRRRCDLTRPFEPFIAAVLISRAQSSVPLEKSNPKKGQSNTNVSGNHPSLNNTTEPAMDGVIMTRLLFTHRDDSENMHVYTAHISRPLLERFQYPNQPPTATTQPLIRLDHCRVAYVPHATFRQRLLAAISVTAIIEPDLEGAPYCGKPALPHYGKAFSAGRRPSEYPRDPFANLDVNLEPHL